MEIWGQINFPFVEELVGALKSIVKAVKMLSSNNSSLPIGELAFLQITEKLEGLKSNISTKFLNFVKVYMKKRRNVKAVSALVLLNLAMIPETIYENDVEILEYSPKSEIIDYCKDLLKDCLKKI
ncbi:hypothetical protein BB558_001635 [Smittium angustum]|uniref:Uncharacterized protein n=1 Tax=Smittium angustum TaxID=133377 RepID=A0A2U1JB23_SMIAN|nr:hypothetical protein BB558_001635 [Smittium angustum]